MVGKKVKNPSLGSSKTDRVNGLANYIVSPENSNESEKCIYAGARGFTLAGTHAARKAEMISLASEAVRSKDPINHYILSWRDGERPTREHVEGAVDILLDELGLQEHQAIYGLHSDTDNLHMHIAVNRVHPETLKVIKPNKGFDIEAVHKAIARIEHAQGWEREKSGRYVVLEDGDLARDGSQIDAGKQRQPDASKRDMENRTGEKSAERIAIEQAGPIIKVAKSWGEIHTKLAEIGMRYEQFGSGAIIFIGEVGVKASNIDRAAGFAKLQKRLGVYITSTREKPESCLRDESTAEPIRKDMPGWNEYITERKAHFSAKNEATLSLRIKQEAERKELAGSQKAQRADLFGKGDWQGRGILLNSMRSIVAASHAVEKISLREGQQQERAQLRQQYRPFPDFEEWLRQINQSDLADRWRHRARDPGVIEGETTEPPTPRDIRSFVPQIHGYQVHYTLKVNVGKVGAATAFVDQGKRIYVHDWQTRHTVLAALQLSAQKWGTFQITGSDKFKAQCAELAAEYGFKINNPELQDSIKQEWQRLQRDRAEALKSVEVQIFEKYHAAVDADRYRVMSIKTYADGNKQTFFLDKSKDGMRGITSEEIVRRTPGILRLQRRGENLFFTPLSETKHLIVLDDLNRGSLEKLRADGFTPAVVLENSPGTFQAIITVSKLNAGNHNEIEKLLTERLNKEYGNLNLAGFHNPHMVPGYETRQPEFQGEDGSYPEVRMISAEKCECKKSLQLAGVIAGEMSAAEKQKEGTQPRSRGGVAIPGTADDAYQRHLKDVLEDNKREGRVVDISRVDAIIAVRMRVTGHSQADVEGAIRKGAPVDRGKEDRNWQDYAKRTAGFAFGAAGLRQAAKVEKDRERLMKIEGREYVPQLKQFHVPEPGEVGKAGKLKKENEKGKDRVKEKDKGMER